jgi:excisionase family DNA binding protein
MKTMNLKEEVKRPSKEEQKAALESYKSLALALEEIHDDLPEIEIQETEERIKIPLNALRLLSQILKETSEGRPVSIVPIATELTTQAAAEMLSCSRPHLIKLLESGKIAYTTVGRHRRIKYEDLIQYKKKQKEEQKKLLIEIMKQDEEDGLYDS